MLLQLIADVEYTVGNSTAPFRKTMETDLVLRSKVKNQALCCLKIANGNL